MSHRLELKAIRGLLLDAENAGRMYLTRDQFELVLDPLITAVRMLTDIVESLEKDCERPNTLPPPPAPPTDPGVIDP